ncbi:PIN domain-containing protein [Favolaschia claudopus]|uniref:PIN domain-containing protein n=1 Tax=Favolaschia claudopus TaxID=2862362 RepID=A0AAW0B0T2_9AGAR
MKASKAKVSRRKVRMMWRSKALKARRRYLQGVLSDGKSRVPVSPKADRLRSLSSQPNRASLSIVPGYTILVIDTNIRLSSLPMFASMVGSLQWTVVIPLPVVTELDGLSSNPSQLGEAAQAALAYLSSHIRSHATSLKVQTTKGNYLTSLNFAAGSAERNMDDLILKAAIWQDEHWVDGLDRNLHIKARSRQLPAASEKDLAAILVSGT